jgi:hypothetical protein
MIFYKNILSHLANGKHLFTITSQILTQPSLSVENIIQPKKKTIHACSTHSSHGGSNVLFKKMEQTKHGLILEGGGGGGSGSISLYSICCKPVLAIKRVLLLRCTCSQTISVHVGVLHGLDLT